MQVGDLLDDLLQSLTHPLTIKQPMCRATGSGFGPEVIDFSRHVI